MHTKKEFFNKKKKALTLSEVLISLVLMGFIMAMTIPTVINRNQTTSYVSGLKKAYGMLDQATNIVMAKNSGTLAYAFTNSVNARDLFGNNLLVYNLTCAAGAVTGNCWTSTTYKLSGGAAVEGFNANTNYEGAILADGTSLLFYITNPTCNGTGVSIDLPYSSSTQTYLCGYIVADVNGYQNSPNTFGRDMYLFLLGTNGLYPGGDPHTIYNDQAAECSTTDTTKNGYGCAAKVLNAGEITY